MKRITLLVSIIAAGFGCEAQMQTRPVYASYEPAPVVVEQAPPSAPIAPTPPPYVDARWVTLADRLPGQTDRQFISMIGRGEYRQIRVQAIRGNPMITQVKIEYVDSPDMQTVTMNQRLPPGQGETIELNGGRRQIKRIIVYSEPHFGGEYSVLGT